MQNHAEPRLGSPPQLSRIPMVGGSEASDCTHPRNRDDLPIFAQFDGPFSRRVLFKPEMGSVRVVIVNIRLGAFAASSRALVGQLCLAAEIGTSGARSWAGWGQSAGAQLTTRARHPLTTASIPLADSGKMPLMLPTRSAGRSLDWICAPDGQEFVHVIDAGETAPPLELMQGWTQKTVDLDE
jgi:hypothetical protein